MKITSGLLLANKPKSLSSFDVIREARKKLGIKKIGHSGTLDPFATGLLVLAIGEATKALQYLIQKDKKYIAKLEFGKSSDTHDAEGVITDLSMQAGRNPIKKNSILEALHEFSGEISQRPPRYSAVKIKGKRACDRMRAGEEINILPKKVIAHELTINKFKWPKIELLIHCSSGFYIRSLARDLGQKLGCGAICTELSRISIGDLTLKNAINTENISVNNIIPLSSNHFNFPSISISQDDVINLRMGRKIPTKHNNASIASAFHADQLIAFGKIEDSYFLPNKILN